MEMEIRKILPQDLLNFYHSEEFKAFENQPISLKRIRSYMENPRISSELPVLYLGYLENKLVVYRTIYQDEIAEGKINVGWLSGVWVHPEFRRQGLAKKLLKEVYQDYEGKIFSTNLGANSLILMQNHPDFEVLKELKGHRFYYRYNLADILPPKSPLFKVSKPILKVLDRIGNATLGKSNLDNKVSQDFQEAEWNEEINEFLMVQQRNSLFPRFAKEFNWIIKNPWVEKASSKSLEDKKYHFTTQSPDFEQKAFVYSEQGNIQSFLVYTIRNGIMKIHYLFSDSEAILDLNCKFILEIIQNRKLACLIVGDQKLKECIEDKKGYFFSKPWSKLYFVGKTFRNQIPTNKEIYLGDGDSIFV